MACIRRLPGVALCAVLLAPAGADEMPAHYLVIGSFGEAANALRWARYNEAFGTLVLADDAAAAERQHRVLVGPLAAANLPYMQAILERAGIVGAWPLASCSGRTRDANACATLPGDAAIAER